MPDAGVNPQAGRGTGPGFGDIFSDIFGLLREFESISSADSARHNPRAKGWFDKVKEFFEG